MEAVGAEVSKVGAGTGFVLKKSLELSMGGVMGVEGDERSIDESSVPLRKPLSMVEKSESLPELSESFEDVAEADRPGRSGAVNACTFVVEMSSVGSDIISRLIVPVAYRTVPFRPRTEESSRFIRFVNALARDMTEVGLDAGKGRCRLLSADEVTSCT